MFWVVTTAFRSPCFQAFEGRGKYTIVQIDADIDWRDEVRRRVLGAVVNHAAGVRDRPHERIIQVGARNIRSARPRGLADALAWGVKFHCPRHCIWWHGRGRRYQDLANGSNVIICFDCDGLDPAIMPGVIGRAPGGLGYWQTIELLNAIAGKAKVCAFDLVEFMPDCDVDRLAR